MLRFSPAQKIGVRRSISKMPTRIAPPLASAVAAPVMPRTASTEKAKKVPSMNTSPWAKLISSTMPYTIV